RCETSLSALFLEKCARQDQITGARDLNITFRAAHNRYWMPESFDEAGFVGPVIFVFGCAVKSLFQESRLKNLRRLSQHEMLARKRRLDKLFFGLLYRIDNGNSENGGAALHGLVNHTFDIGNRNEWPNTVMYGDDIRGRLKVLEPHCDGILAPFAPLDNGNGLLKAGPLHKACDFFQRFPGRRNNNVIDCFAGIELADSVNDNRRTVQRKELLRAVHFHTAARTRSRDNGANFHTRKYRRN